MALARRAGRVSEAGQPSNHDGDGWANDRHHARAAAVSVTDVGDDPIVVEPPVDLERGTVLAGRYQIETFVGKGGSGVVMRAFDRITQSPVALKILSAELASDPRWTERFSRELRLGRQIQHPHVCRVFDIGEAEGHRFLSMELATKGNLREMVVPEAAPRPFADRLADARALVEGLAALHQAGIIHRDVKPENLLRMEDGRVVLTDFGLATNPTQTKAVTVLVGTPSYMAPEIVMGDPASFSSDVWALGVTMHEILFGKRPEWEIVERGERRFCSPVGKGGSSAERALADLCARCAAERPEMRPADATEVLALLTRRKTPPRTIAAVRTARARRSQLGWLAVTVSVAIVAGVASTRGRLLSGAWATLSSSSPRSIDPQGVPADWEKASRVLANLPGRVHCFTASRDQKSAQIIWGMPPVAEMVDVATGHRSPARLLRATYQDGCPDLSPDGEKLLFAATDATGAAEIMLSDHADGSNARSITRGSLPAWLANGSEFLYNVDGLHVGVFHLPTMNFSVIDGTDQNQGGFLEAVEVNQARTMVAIRRADEHLNSTVSIRSWSGPSPLARFGLPDGTGQIAFSPFAERLLFSVEASSSSTHLAELDWASGSARKLGAVSGWDIRGMIRGESGQALFVTRRLTGDVWLHAQDGSSHVLTTDGENWSADQAPTGHLAIGKRTSDGKMIVSATDPEGRVVFTSEGPNDRSPSFSNDGKTLLFVRLSTGSIVRCDGAPLSCRAIHEDNSLPIWPKLSPDGRFVSYVTQVGVPRLHVISGDGRLDRDLGPARADCPSVWANPDQLWIYQGNESERYWGEFDLVSGRATGKQKPAPNSSGPDACSRRAEEWSSPFFDRATIVKAENSSVRVLAGVETP